MERINVIIVEDVLLIAEDIASRLGKNNMLVAGIFSTAEEAIESIPKSAPDLILMDIHLGGKLDGIEAAHQIQKRWDIPIIYLSDHTDRETVERAKKTHPANYLSKPFNDGDLIRSIEIAIENWQKLPARAGSILEDFVFIKKDSGFVKVACADILFLKAGRAYCDIVTRGATYVQSNNMGYIFDRISHKDFIRVHRSYVVNVNCIDRIDGNVICIGMHRVEMSESMRDELLGRLKFI